MASNQFIEQNVLKATRIIEHSLDEELEKLSNITGDELDVIRKKRLSDMRKSAKDRETWLANGHGVYYEISEEREFFNEVNKSSNVVCHFYRTSTFRCQIVDKHLGLLAPKHVECKFIKLNAEKSPFLTDRLNVFVIPTIVLVKDEKVADYIVGFDELGGHDEFTTEMLEWRIAQAEVIEYGGDLLTPPDNSSRKPSKNKDLLNFDRRKKTKTIRGKNPTNDSDDEDEDDW